MKNDELTKSPANEEERDAALVALKDEAMRVWGTRKWSFERDWYRNILFYVGQQWLTYEPSARRWRKQNLPGYVPKPVTNRFCSTANTIRSAVAQVQPAFRGAPARDTESAVLASQAADKYLDLIQQEGGFRNAKRKLAGWVVLTGNGFLLSEFDTSPDTGTVDIPHEVCLDCQAEIEPADLPADGTCPQCGGPNLMEHPENKATVPQGALKVRALSPFEIYLDHNILDLQDQPLVVVRERHSLVDARALWKDKAEDIEEDNESDVGITFLTSLALATSTGYGSIGTSTNSVQGNGNVTIYRMFCKRHLQFPNGFYAVVNGNGKVLEFHDPYPHRYLHTGKPFYPMVHVRYDDVPGRFWAKTPMDDLAPKQRQRNEFESLFQTITMRAASPVWLVPTNVQHTPITGDPSIVIRYTPAGGQKPERTVGIDPPQSILAMIQQCDQDFEELASTFAAIKGKNPGSIRAASAIQMLVERGMGRFGSVFDNLEEAYETWGRQALEIWRQRAVFPRVQALSQAAGTWQFMEFSGADLGEVDIRVEVGSTRPKSQAGEQMMIQTLVNMGALNPADPEQRTKIVEKLGAIDMLPGSTEDLKVIAEENAKFMQWAMQIAPQIQAMQQQVATQVPDPMMAQQMMMQMLAQSLPLEGSALFDNHALHAVHHRRLALSEKFRALPKILRDVLEFHVASIHLPHLLQEASTGIGTLTLMGGAIGQPGQAPGGGGQLGKHSGGSKSPFGADGNGNQARGGKSGDSVGEASMKGTG